MLAVALLQLNAQRIDETRDVGIQRVAAAHVVLEAATEAGPDGREDEPVRKRQYEAIGEAERLAAALARRGGDTTAKERLDECGTLGDLLVHAVVDAIEDARHGEENRRLHDREIRDQVRDVVVDGDGASHAEQAV